MPLLPPVCLQLVGLSKRFHLKQGEIEAISDVSLSLHQGEIVTLVGSSGCGKSTLLRIIAGLTEPTAGQVIVPGADGRRQIGYMPQRDLLLPWRTVVDNIALPMVLQGRPKAESRAEARHLLPYFGLSQFADLYPHRLSGGMRQRAAFLRTVMGGHDILLLDEPFGALDAATRRDMQDWLLDRQRHNGWTFLFVTHDVDEAVYLADRVVVLTPRPARIASQIPIDLPRPRRRDLVADPIFGRAVADILKILATK